jgi:N6-L-threonylcarbamoyladenine synthase
MLGLETSCDETAAAVVRLAADGGVTVLSDIILSQTVDHAPFGGVVPEIAARAHVEAIDGVVSAAMRTAGLAYADLSGVAATAGPGLIGGVMVGLVTGKALALAHGLPLVAVNHLEGHALSPLLSGPCAFPYLLLLVSGGHCQLVAVESLGRYVRYGSTLDDAAGEAFDKAAKVLGLGFPGGPALESAAAEGDATGYEPPRALAGRAGCDFSFAGIKTWAMRTAAERSPMSEADRRNIAAAFQAGVVRHIESRTHIALQRFRAEHPPSWRLVAAGGVAANQSIRAALEAAARREGFTFQAPPLRHCTDNAAMIALAGALRLAAGQSDGWDVAARPRWPLDPAAAAAAPTHRAGRKGPKA